MRPNHHRFHRLPLGLLYAASTLAVAYWLRTGWSYYRLDATSRPRHPDYASLTSGGELGHFFGIVGSALIILLLLYIPRKRWKALSRAGSLRVWLDVHIWMGITGPLLIVLHSAFKVKGLVAFSFWSMAAVALSGVLGRYLYLQIPRDEGGEELDSQGMQARHDRLLVEAGLSWDQLPGSIQRGLGEGGGGLASWLAHDLAWPFRRARWRRELLAGGAWSAGEAGLAGAVRALRTLEVLQRRRQTLEQARRLLHGWHVFHRPFAFTMIFFMIIHIVVVLLFKSNHGVAP